MQKFGGTFVVIFMLKLKYQNYILHILFTSILNCFNFFVFPCRMVNVIEFERHSGNTFVIVKLI